MRQVSSEQDQVEKGEEIYSTNEIKHARGEEKSLPTMFGNRKSKINP